MFSRLRTLRIFLALALVPALITAASIVAQAQETEQQQEQEQQSAIGLPPPTEQDTLAYPVRDHYSPYAGRNFPTQVYWGDTHLHTGMSMDAGAFGARLTPRDAYQFARDEEITSSTGLQVKLSRPLDFLVVADHSDNMGFFPSLLSGDPDMLADPKGRDWYERIQQGGQEAVSVAVEIIQSLTNNNFPPSLYLAPGTDGYRDAWDEQIAAAEEPTPRRSGTRPSADAGRVSPSGRDYWM